MVEKKDFVDATGKTLDGEGVTTVVQVLPGVYQVMLNGAPASLPNLTNIEAAAALAEAIRIGWDALLLQANAPRE